MPEFYYEGDDEKSVYHVDELSQQLLVYLSAYGRTSLRGIVDKVHAESRLEIQTRINDCLGPDAANLIIPSRYTQQTFDGDEERIQYELTDKGEMFVNKYKSNFAMPADFKEVSDTVNEIRSEISEINDSMHRIDAQELNERLSEIMHRLETLQDHLSNYS